MSAPLPPRTKYHETRVIVVNGPIAAVPLTRGHFAIIDASDVPLVIGRNWAATPERCGRVYASTRVTAEVNRSRNYLMHRVIAGASPGQEVDHRDGDGTNNRRSNLRVCSRQENGWNRGKDRTNTTGFKGIYWRKARGHYVAHIRVNVTRHYLGSFSDPIEAARAYDRAAIAAFGEFALVNFPSAEHPHIRALHAGDRK